MVSIHSLRGNPEQPRRNFDESALLELSASIREHGIIQPILVEDDGAGGYLIVAGERRFRAAKLAGLEEVPVLVRSFSDAKRLEVALVENVQRSDLNPIEEAEAYRKLMDLTGLSQDGVAEKVGKSRSTVANALRLLKLPSDVREAIAAGALTPGHARAVLSVDTPEGQRSLFATIVAEGISVREAERMASALNAGEALTPGTAGASKAPKAAGTPAAAIPELRDMEQRFIDRLGTKVAISGDLKRGSIRIDYYSMDDLDRLFSIISET